MVAVGYTGTAPGGGGGGDASAANQVTEIARLTSIEGDLPAQGQATMAASMPVAIASNQTAVPVSAAALPLPSGAATAANQATEVASLASIDTKTLAAGQAAMAASSPVVIASNQTAVPVSGTVTANAGTGTRAVAGDVASGSADSGNPVKLGGVGRTANPTAVTNGQRVDATFDKLGKQIVVGSLRALKGRQATTITSSTAETTIVTADATNFLDMYGLILTNTSATATKVTIRDATAGGTPFVVQVPAGDTRGFMLPEGGAVLQGAVNNNWTAQCGTSVAALEITALFVKNL